MPDKKQDQRDRADRLRRQIERSKQADDAPEGEEQPEQQPDESPKEYVERRMREIARKKRASG